MLYCECFSVLRIHLLKLAEIAGCSEKHVWTFNSLPIIWGMAKWLHQPKLWHSGRIQGLLSLFSEQCAKFLRSKFIHRGMAPSQLRQHSNNISNLNYFPPREKQLCSIGGGRKQLRKRLTRLNIVKWTTQQGQKSEWSMLLSGIPPLNQSAPNCCQTMPFYFTTWAHTLDFVQSPAQVGGSFQDQIDYSSFNGLLCPGSYSLHPRPRFRTLV